MPFFGTYHFRKSAPIPKKMTCEPDPSVVSFLPGLGLTKTTVLESMRTLSYFRLDTLTYYEQFGYQASSAHSGYLHLAEQCQVNSRLFFFFCTSVVS